MADCPVAQAVVTREFCLLVSKRGRRGYPDRNRSVRLIEEDIISTEATRLASAVSLNISPTAPFVEDGCRASGDASGIYEQMAQKKNPKTRAKKDGRPTTDSKNGLKSDGGGVAAGGVGPKTTMFTWFVVLALLGVWSSVAVVYFDVVDYDSVIGKLMVYDRDGDGDFDMEDAKVLLGLTKDGDDSENADSLEEVLDILAQEGSDWFYGFFTFLHDVVTSPINRGVMEEEEQEEEGDEDRQAASQREGGAASDDMVEGVILDLLNQ